MRILNFYTSIGKTHITILVDGEVQSFDVPASVMSITEITDAYVRESLTEDEYLLISGENANVSPIEGLTKQDGLYYLEGDINPLPNFIVDKVKAGELSVDTLKLFWAKLQLNPNLRVRKELLHSISTYGFNLTTSGNIIAYRNVVVAHCDYSMHEVRSIMFDYSYNNGKWDDKIILHSQHDRSFRYNLRSIASMPREGCDESSATCSTGLHCASSKWLTQNYFGNVGLCVLVNPMDIVSAPEADNYGKFRTCRMYVVGPVDYTTEGKLIELDNIEEYSKDFDDISLEDLKKELVNTGAVPFINTGEFINFEEISKKFVSHEKSGDPLRQLIDIYYEEEEDGDDDEYDEYVDGYDDEDEGYYDDDFSYR